MLSPCLLPLLPDCMHQTSSPLCNPLSRISFSSGMAPQRASSDAGGPYASIDLTGLDLEPEPSSANCSPEDGQLVSSEEEDNESLPPATELSQRELDEFDLGPSAFDELAAMVDSRKTQRTQAVIAAAFAGVEKLRAWIHADDDVHVWEMAVDLADALGPKLYTFTLPVIAATAIYLSMHKRTRVESAHEWNIYMHSPAHRRRVWIPTRTIAQAVGCPCALMLACAASVSRFLQPYVGVSYTML